MLKSGPQKAKKAIHVFKEFEIRGNVGVSPVKGWVWGTLKRNTVLSPVTYIHERGSTAGVFAFLTRTREYQLAEGKRQLWMVRIPKGTRFVVSPWNSETRKIRAEKMILVKRVGLKKA